MMGDLRNPLDSGARVRVLGGGYEQEMRGAVMDEEYDALNDETFGGTLEPASQEDSLNDNNEWGDDWEMEQLAEQSAMLHPGKTEKEPGQSSPNVEEMWEESISRMVADDDDDLPPPSHPFIDTTTRAINIPAGARLSGGQNIWGSPMEDDTVLRNAIGARLGAGSAPKNSNSAGGAGSGVPSHEADIYSMVTPPNGHQIDSLRAMLQEMKLKETLRSSIRGAKTVEELEAEFRRDNAAPVASQTQPPTTGGGGSSLPRPGLTPPTSFSGMSCEEIERQMRDESERSTPASITRTKAGMALNGSMDPSSPHIPPVPPSSPYDTSRSGGVGPGKPSFSPRLPPPPLPPFPPPPLSFFQQLGLPPPHLLDPTDPKIQQLILAHLAVLDKNNQMQLGRQGQAPTPPHHPPGAYQPHTNQQHRSHNDSGGGSPRGPGGFCRKLTPPHRNFSGGVNRDQDRSGTGGGAHAVVARRSSYRDPYSGMMSNRDIDWLMRIQLHQTATNNPLVDDYYWMMYRNRKRSGLPVELAKDIFPDDPYFTPKKDPEADGNSHVYVPPAFEGSLGKVQILSATCPRQLLDLSSSWSSSPTPDSPENGGGPGAEGDSRHGHPLPSTATRRRYKYILVEIENLFSTLLDCEDVVYQLSILPNNACCQLLELMELKLGEVCAQLEGPKIALFLQIPKGRRCLARFLPLFPPKEAWKVIQECLSVLHMLVKRDAKDRYGDDLREGILWQCISELESGRLEAILSTPQALAAPHSTTIANRFSFTLLSLLVKRALMLSDQESGSRAWVPFVVAWAKEVCTLPKPPVRLVPFDPALIQRLSTRCDLTPTEIAHLTPFFAPIPDPESSLPTSS